MTEAEGQENEKKKGSSMNHVVIVQGAVQRKSIYIIYTMKCFLLVM